MGSVPMLPLPVRGSTLLHTRIFQDSQSFQVWPWTDTYARSTRSHLPQVMIMGGSENRVTDAGSRPRSTLGFVVPSRPDRSLLLSPTKPSLRAAAPGRAQQAVAGRGPSQTEGRGENRINKQEKVLRDWPRPGSASYRPDGSGWGRMTEMRLTIIL